MPEANVGRCVALVVLVLAILVAVFHHAPDRTTNQDLLYSRNPILRAAQPDPEQPAPRPRPQQQKHHQEQQPAPPVPQTKPPAPPSQPKPAAEAATASTTSTTSSSTSTSSSAAASVKPKAKPRAKAKPAEQKHKKQEKPKQAPSSPPPPSPPPPAKQQQQQQEQAPKPEDEPASPPRPKNAVIPPRKRAVRAASTADQPGAVAVAAEEAVPEPASGGAAVAPAAKPNQKKVPNGPLSALLDKDPKRTEGDKARASAAPSAAAANAPASPPPAPTDVVVVDASSISTNVPAPAPTAGDALVAEALAMLRDLDRARPEWHHFGHRNVRAILDGPKDQMYSLFGTVDVHFPADFLALFDGSLDSDHEVRRELRAYNAKAKDAVRKLKYAWEANRHTDAGFLLAQIALFGNYSLPIAPQVSFDLLHTLASSTGNATAHYYLSVFYATNLGGVLGSGPLRSTVRQDKAFLHLTLAASSGDFPLADMALAYRYLHGIGVAADCERSAAYYQRVATRVLRHYYSGPPGGRTLPSPRVRLADEAGGVYGPGSTFVADRPSQDLSEEDAFEYYKTMAEKGDLAYQFTLANMFYLGTHTIEADLKLAFKYYSMAAAFDVEAEAASLQYEHGPASSRAKDEIQAVQQRVGLASAMVGQMYVRGEAVPANNATASRWFERAVKYSDPLGHYWSAVMAIDRLDAAIAAQKRLATAKESAEYRRLSGVIAASAKAGRHEAQAYVGLNLASRGEYTKAIQYLSLASSKGHLPASHRLAELHYYGRGTSRICTVANTYLKSIAERGMEWFDPTLTTAYNVLGHHNTDLAVLLYLMAAERGVEVAQANLAWLLDQRNAHRESDSLIALLYPLVAPKSASASGTDVAASAAADSDTHAHEPWTSYFPARSVDLDELALMYWVRSANQNQEDSRVKVGDYHYHGRGTLANPAHAATAYLAATESQQSGIAMWSAGYMYHHGLGVPKDRHLAKRYYDLALSTNADAWLPVSASLLHLQVSAWWDRVRGVAEPDAPRQQEQAAVDAPNKRKDAPAAAAAGKKQAAGSSASKSPDARRESNSAPVPEAPAPARGADDSHDWTWRDLVKRRHRGSSAAAAAASSATAATDRMPNTNSGGNILVRTMRLLGSLIGVTIDDDDDVEFALLICFCSALVYLVYVRHLQVQRVAEAERRRAQERAREGLVQAGVAAVSVAVPAATAPAAAPVAASAPVAAPARVPSPAPAAAPAACAEPASSSSSAAPAPSSSSAAASALDPAAAAWAEREAEKWRDSKASSSRTTAATETDPIRDDEPPVLHARQETPSEEDLDMEIPANGPARAQPNRPAVYVTEWTDADAAALPAIFNSNPSIHANTMRVPDPYTEGNAVSFIDFVKRSYASGNHELALRVDSPTGRVIGGFMIEEQTLRQGIPESPHAASGLAQDQLRSWLLGYWLDGSMRGRSIAPRVVEATLREAEAQGNVVRVALDCFVENVPSRRVAEKAGFELEGRTRACFVKDGKLRDIYTFSWIAPKFRSE
ncbi:ERAD-associated protein [Blastocladiella emersonii ATCC 22665]|nr:ERAD-associated protein [Blastocladiella emersonii ATCC 22665]